MAWIYHPKLGRTVEVPDSAAKVWAHSGWQPTEPPAPQPEPADQQPAAAPRRRKSEPAGPAPTTEE